MEKDYFVIGKIVNTQGLKGEVRIIPTTDDINRFKNLDKVLTAKDEKEIYFEIENVRFHKKFVLVKFKGIDDISDAEKLRNFELKVTKDEAIPCEKDEYYIKDLYDMSVFTIDNEYLGQLKDIIFTGANDVYVIEDKIEGKKKQILIPAIKQCIFKVNVKEKTMYVKLLEGLR